MDRIRPVHSLECLGRLRWPPAGPALRDTPGVLAPIVVLLLLVATERFIDDALNFTADLQTGITTTIHMILFVLAAWVAYAFVLAVAESIIATPRLRLRSSESALLRIGSRLVGFLSVV